MLRPIAFVATALLAACPSGGAQAPRAVDDRPLRIRIAQAEARRGAGLDELSELASHGEPHARELALRGLGRIGGARAREILVHALDERDPAIVTAAVSALGVTASLDEPDAAEARVLGEQLVRAMTLTNYQTRGAGGDPRALLLAGIEALGRAGSGQQGHLARALGSPDPSVARAAGLALGRYGRRKQHLEAPARRALVAATSHVHAEVRYAATYALAREHEPPEDAAVAGALAARVVDDSPDVRAVAIAGLAKRGAIEVARKDITDSLRDRDWRVAVEAVRALAGEHGDPAGRDAVAAALMRRWTELEHGNEAEAHVIIEALRIFMTRGVDSSAVLAILIDLAAKADNPAIVAPLVRGWIACLATAAASRMAAPKFESIAGCGHGNLPDHLRLPLLAELVTAGAGGPAFHRVALRLLFTHADARVRAAALGALAATWRDGDDGDHQAIVATLASALGAADPILASAAVDAAPAIYELVAADPMRLAIDAAVVARASTEHDVELGAALYELIGKRAIAAGAEACRAGLAGHPVRARAAAACLKALGEAVPVPPIAAADPPPVDIAAVIGRDVRWHLVTSRGEVVIALSPDVAPWNVATIVALTRRGFYDGLEFHRVVPGFVVQGGDPTMSGVGGPGFTTPAEPATEADGPGFAAGGAGIADAGRDSGGSQWFVMHGAAPHLDGRYTWLGSVVSGQKSADALVIGDRIVHATVEVR